MALTKKSSRSLQRQIDLTTAVCQERLLATHVRHVLALVELVQGQVPFDDAVDIYVRILRLNTEQARNVASRALAELGKNGFTEPKTRPREEVTAEDEHEVDEDESNGRSEAIFSRLKRRIRGRVQEGLRERINLAAARTEDELLETHVENALLFIRALGDEASASDAVETYLEIMMIPEGVADVVYHRALRVLADDLLPPLPEREESQVAVPPASVAAVEGATE